MSRLPNSWRSMTASSPGTGISSTVSSLGISNRPWSTPVFVNAGWIVDFGIDSGNASAPFSASPQAMCPASSALFRSTTTTSSPASAAVAAA